MQTRTRPFLLLAALVCLTGCSTQQAYYATQAWQQQECNKLPDANERSQCLSRANTSYEQYKRQTQ
jgi:hypothetical protein